MEPNQSFKQVVCNSLMKLVFELIGTTLLTMFFDNSQNSRFGGFRQSQVVMLLGMWILIIFGMRISGAHYNPAVTLAQMLRKDTGNFPRLLGFAYFLFQFLGGVAGAFLAWFFDPSQAGSGNINLPINQYQNYIIPGIISELLGSFFFVLFFLLQTEPKTQFSKEAANNSFIIAAAYVGSRSFCAADHITMSGACLNPAIAFGTSFTQLFSKGGYGFRSFWFYVAMPFAGALAAVIFHEFAFKKTQELLNQSQNDEEEDELAIQQK